MSLSSPPRLGFSSKLFTTNEFTLIEDIIEDRGSKYSVSYGKVAGREDIKKFLVRLRTQKRYAKADHHSWAARIVRDGVLYEFKNDDGETGAGKVILNMLQRSDVGDTIVCVTRWFGGVKLMNDRYKHIQDAARVAIADIDDKIKQ